MGFHICTSLVGERERESLSAINVFFFLIVAGHLLDAYPVRAPGPTRIFKKFNFF